MSQPAITVEHLSKRYRLGTYSGYKTLRETLSDVGRRRNGKSSARQEIWALDDVSFEVMPGELIGVLGRNGAGKSTILKVLSRITKPTKGRATIRGRVGLLLEVGTGFHPELTGRENVFLNGAILGMRKSEIQRRFDEIVDFSEIGEFLDTPIKRYSSGMQMRLAFAVAAHLEPEILIIDEVLAVGDIAFQKKCLGKIGEVTNHGRTVLFVSHNMSVIQGLCHRGILMSKGSIVTDAPIHDAVRAYLQMLEEMGVQSVADRLDRHGWGEVRATEVRISGPIAEGRLMTGEPATFAVQVEGALARSSCVLALYNDLGLPISAFDSAIATASDTVSSGSNASFECAIAELPLVPGRYRVDVEIRARGQIQDHLEGAAYFEVETGAMRGRPLAEAAHGDIVVPHVWRLPRGAGDSQW
jgi:lipopolysaccharide transport system ATP-binding protein